MRVCHLSELCVIMVLLACEAHLDLFQLRGYLGGLSFPVCM